MDKEDRAFGLSSACEMALKRFEGLTTESLIRRQELGDASFEPLRSTLDSMFETIGLAAKLNLNRLDAPTLQVLRNTLSAMFERVERLNKYRAIGPTAQDRQPAMDAFLEEWRQQIDRISGPLALAVHKQSSDRVASQVEAQAKLVAESLKKAEADRDEISAILTQAQSLSAQTGVTVHARAFKDQASSHGRAAAWWTGATLLSGAVTVWLAYRLFEGKFKGSDESWTGPLAIRSLAFRVVLLSLCTYFVAWFARNYRANKHNQLANLHRVLALESFESFVKATQDQDTRNAVLLQATQSIFTATRSGYLEKEPAVSPHSTIVEVLRRSDAPK